MHASMHASLVMVIALVALLATPAAAQLPLQPENVPVVPRAGSAGAEAAAAQVTRGWVCEMCHDVFTIVQKAAASNTSANVLAKLVDTYCVAKKIQDKTVCAGIVSEYKNEFVYIGAHMYEPEQVCQYLRLCPLPGVLSAPPPPPATPPLASAAETLAAARTRNHTASASVGHMLHLSDIHLDLHYIPGTKMRCDEPLCCRAHNGIGEAGNAAGRWGSLASCDVPAITFESMWVAIAENYPHLDYALWTGDDPPHDVWMQSRRGNLAYARLVHDRFLQYYPDLQVLPSFGNHESFPVDQFRDNSTEMAWLYEATGELWASWLSPGEVEEMHAAGFYTRVLAPGLRVISLNTQHCDSKNFWLVLQKQKGDLDAGGQLAWLNRTLAEARAAGERVWLEGHIPLGNGKCQPAYERAYADVVTPYADVIVASFFGHTHKDQWRVWHEPGALDRPLWMEYIAPSVTTYSNLNPSFRVYSFDKATGEILDYEQWHFDVEEANAADAPQWRRYYTASEYYGLSSMAPSQWMDAAQRMWKDDALMQRCFEAYWSFGSDAKGKTFDAKFRTKRVCDMIHNSESAYQACRGAKTPDDAVSMYLEEVMSADC